MESVDLQVESKGYVRLTFILQNIAHLWFAAQHKLSYITDRVGLCLAW
jgi:hypothetical protein